jgi:hypothetical protein
MNEKQQSVLVKISFSLSINHRDQGEPNMGHSIRCLVCVRGCLAEGFHSGILQDPIGQVGEPEVNHIGQGLTDMSNLGITAKKSTHYRCFYLDDTVIGEKHPNPGLKWGRMTVSHKQEVPFCTGVRDDHVRVLGPRRM